MNKNNMNDGHIYEALNYYKLDEDIDIDEIEEVDEITSKRIKNKLKFKLNNKSKYKGLKVAGVTLFIAANIILVSTGGVDVYAKIGKSVMGSIAELRNDTFKYDKYSNRINESVTNNGIKFTINEIVSDGNKIVMSYSIISEKGSLKDKIKRIDGIGPWPSIGGKMFTGLGREGKMVNETRYDGCDWIRDVGGLIPNGDFKLDLLMKDIGELKGNWDISIKVNSDKIKKDVKEYNINKEFKIQENCAINISKIITSPLSVGVKFTGSYGVYNYIVLDDKGNELNWNGTSSSNGKSAMEYSGLLSGDTNKLTFIPFRFNEDYKPKFKFYDINKLPIKIEQGSYGSLTINKVEWTDNNKLRISYEVDSKYPLIASWGPSLLDEKNNELSPDNMNNLQVSQENQKDF
ncbi:MAG: DUF4179 domain-containing protein, partial [Clostridium sp.]